MGTISSLSLWCEKLGNVSTGCGSTREDEVKTGFPDGQEAGDDSKDPRSGELREVLQAVPVTCATPGTGITGRQGFER